LLVGAVVVGLPLIGEIIGLSAYDLSRARFASLVVTCLTVMGMWLLVAMVLGAVTRDLRTLIVALVCAIVVLFVSGWVVNRALTIFAAREGRGILIAVAVIGGLATLAALYNRPGWRWRAWLASGLTSGCALVTAFGTSATPVPVLKADVAGPLQLRIDRPEQIARYSKLNLLITAPSAPDSLRALFSAESVTVRLADGSKITLSAFSGATPLHDAAMPVGDNIRWRSFRSHNTGAAVWADLTRPQVQALSRGIREIEVKGHVRLIRPLALGTLPLIEGSSIRGDGTKTTLTTVDRSAENLSLTVSSVGVAESEGSLLGLGSSRWEGLHFALVNRQRGEAWELSPRSSWRNSQVLLLPGTSAMQDMFRFEHEQGRGYFGPAAPPDNDWLRDAELFVGSLVSAGEYDARVRANFH
jgi:hypothetical protein